jgi:hypothetical protein
MRLACTCFVTCLSVAAAAGNAHAQGAALENESAENAVYVELGGAGAWYTLNYERYLRKDASVRVGAMYMSIEASAGSSSAKASWIAVPIMFNYLGLAAGSHALELGAGIDMMYFSGASSAFDATAESSGVVPVGTANLGYRYSAPEGGFVFRAGYTPLVFVTTETKEIFHWGGLSFGYRF